MVKILASPISILHAYVRPIVAELPHDLLCLRARNLVTAKRIIEICHSPIFWMPLTIFVEEFALEPNAIDVPNANKV